LTIAPREVQQRQLDALKGARIPGCWSRTKISFSADLCGTIEKPSFGFDSELDALENKVGAAATSSARYEGLKTSAPFHFR
jgi:hypothetical protein